MIKHIDIFQSLHGTHAYEDEHSCARSFLIVQEMLRHRDPSIASSHSSANHEIDAILPITHENIFFGTATLLLYALCNPNYHLEKRRRIINA